MIRMIEKMKKILIILATLDLAVNHKIFQNVFIIISNNTKISLNNK